MAPKRKHSSIEDNIEFFTPIVHSHVLNAEHTFGSLYDGANFYPSANDLEGLNEFRRAFQLRRDLAELSHRPEGYIFSWVDRSGRLHTAPLLTPPDFVAVQNVDGTWHREPRVVTREEPVPYSQTWYAEYLLHYSLPAYFMRPGHLAMLGDDYEANTLGLQNAPSPHYAAIPRQGYLNHQYPAIPLWPRAVEEEPYRIRNLSSDTRAILSRYHPALGVTGFPYNVYVWPSGNIQVRSTVEVEEQGCPIRDEDRLDWNSYEEGGRVPSSYLPNRRRVRFSTDSLAGDRHALIQRHVDEHHLINPMEDIPGAGSLEFLGDADQQRAVAMGFVDENGQASAHQVTLARRRGELAVGTGQNAGPIVIFHPDPDQLNPREDPPGPGRWQFLTSDGPTSNRGLAAINFGGSHGLPSYPTARQIRRLGQLFNDDGREDLTAMIDIVWAAGQNDIEPGVDPVLDVAPELEKEPTVVPSDPAMVHSSPRRGPGSSTAPVSAAGQPSASDGVSDPPAVVHNPANNDPGGPHDQTGQWAVYDTKYIRGQDVTVDRSRAWLGYPEPHKLWCYGARGWKKWQHAHSMDWNDKAKVTALNKHREQAYQRARIWNKLREQPRKDYTPAENAFIMEMIKKAKGQKPEQPIQDLARDFNSRFGARWTRTESAIASLIERLRKEYGKYGDLKARRKRGWKKQQESAILGDARVFDAPEEEESVDKDEDAPGEDDDEEDALGEENGQL